jgi:hypothetical protein
MHQFWHLDSGRNHEKCLMCVRSCGKGSEFAVPLMAPIASKQHQRSKSAGHHNLVDAMVLILLYLDLLFSGSSLTHCLSPTMSFSVTI